MFLLLWVELLLCTCSAAGRGLGCLVQDEVLKEVCPLLLSGSTGGVHLPVLLPKPETESKDRNKQKSVHRFIHLCC